MGRNGLLIGEVAKRSGVSRKALRLYEAVGILPAPSRTAAAYRLYGAQTPELISFVKQAQRLGFTLQEIKEIAAIKRAGRVPCPHVRNLVRRKVEELEAALSDLRALLNGWRLTRGSGAVVCPHIERASGSKYRRANSRRRSDGEAQDVPVPVVHRVPRGRDRR